MMMMMKKVNIMNEEENRCDSSILGKFFDHISIISGLLKRTMEYDEKEKIFSFKKSEIILRKINFILCGIEILLTNSENYSEKDIDALFMRDSEWIRIYTKYADQPIDCMRDFLSFERSEIPNEYGQSSYILVFYGADCSFHIPLDDILRIERVYLTFYNTDIEVEKEVIWNHGCKSEK